MLNVCELSLHCHTAVCSEHTKTRWNAHNHRKISSRYCNAHHIEYARVVQTMLSLSQVTFVLGMMCPVTMPLTYILIQIQACRMRLNTVLVDAHECVWVCARGIHMKVQLRRVPYTMGCCCHPVELAFIHMDIVAWMHFYHCSKATTVFHLESWAELRLGEKRMNDLFKLASTRISYYTQRHKFARHSPNH